MAFVSVKTGFGSVSGTPGNLSGGAAGATVATITYTAGGTGNLVLVWVTMVPQSASPTSVSLTATGWTFSQVGGIINGGASAGCGAIFVAYAPNTSAATLTLTWNQPTANWFSDLIQEFSGGMASSPTAGSNFATGTGTPTVSLTPTANSCLIWVACNDSVTAVGSIGGITAIKGADDTQGDWSEYQVLTGNTGVAQSCTITGSGAYLIGAVAIRPAGSDPTIGSVPSGTAMTAGSLSAPFLFFDTGDYSPGL
jgi:hypothetical protein